MNTDRTIQTLSSFFLLDAARATEENLIYATEKNENVISLYRGRSEESLSAVAPYIFTFPHSEDFSDFIMKNGWGRSWGVLVYSESDMDNLFKHFRKFLMVKTEEGKELYFRFYDPRVLRIFLPSCDAEQLKEFFGPVEKFIVEGDTKEEAVVFTLQDGELQQSVISAAAVFGLSPASTLEEPPPGLAKKKRNTIIVIDDTPDDKEK
ncbi:MAG: DUF4123 domain-containing protein [Bacteroidota bacterium]